MHAHTSVLQRRLGEDKRQPLEKSQILLLGLMHLPYSFTVDLMNSLLFRNLCFSGFCSLIKKVLEINVR